MNPTRFWAKVDRSGECREWRGTRDRHGYGIIKIRSGNDAKTKRAHRVAWELINGAIPDGMYVLHRCDNPPCCNPTHLFLGTHADNMDDMKAKGRQASGEHHGRAKLTDGEVANIRGLIGVGVPVRAIARAKRLSRRAIRAIASRETWRHVA